MDNMNEQAIIEEETQTPYLTHENIPILIGNQKNSKIKKDFS